MNIKADLFCVALLLFALPVSSPATQAEGESGSSSAHLTHEADLFQVSTLGALTKGVFEGALPISQLRHYGNFGVGTFDGIDGEMIVLNGHFYHARSDGSVEESKNTELASFAAVVAFVPQRKYEVSNLTLAELNTYIATLIPSSNYFYAIRIHGLFNSVTARAIPKLAKPYPTLAEATKQQVTFTRQSIEGTAVVIRSPTYVSNLNVAGDHFHFISDDKHFGGHALDLNVGEATLEIHEIRRNTLLLPATPAFQAATLP